MVRRGTETSGAGSEDTEILGEVQPADPDVTSESRPGGAADKSMGFGRHILAFVKELSVVVIGAVVVAALLRGFVGQAFLIPSGSMENTLRINDRIVVEKLSSVKRGQVIVFADPGGWLTDTPKTDRGPVGRALEFIGILPDTGTDHLTKRVIGLPGDQVVCCDSQGRITVNEQPLDETGYLYRDARGTQVDPSDIKFSVTVPADRIFVMGDHRNFSRDSRCHLNDPAGGSGSANSSVGDNAFVPMDDVVGRAVAIYWPFDHLASLKTPATFASVPPGQSPAPQQASIKAGPDADC